MATWNKNISLRVLRTFCAAAEKESFRDAADAMYLTSSAVSHQIKQLESELGKALFTRSARSLHLSKAGQELYDDLTPILQQLDSTIESHSASQALRTLRVSVQPHFANEVFVPQLNDFVERHPAIDIRVDTSDETEEKHPVTADISIRLFRTPPPSLAFDKLFSLRLIPASSPEFYDTVKVVGGRITSDFPLLVYTERPQAWQKWQKSSRIRLPSNAPVIRFDSMTAVIKAAEKGMGAALVPVLPGTASFESGELVPLFDHTHVTNSAYYLVYRQKDKESEAVVLFRNWALQKFSHE
tara:strand:+ start:13659 stop:14552 length:894 start_codon:yes stop_codon:yes gene_type:complete